MCPIYLKYFFIWKHHIIPVDTSRLMPQYKLNTNLNQCVTQKGWGGVSLELCLYKTLGFLCNVFLIIRMVKDSCISFLIREDKFLLLAGEHLGLSLLYCRNHFGTFWMPYLTQLMRQWLITAFDPPIFLAILTPL